MSSRIQVVSDNVERFQKSFSALVETQVLVGIPSKTAQRKGDPINNAAIGYIMENGAPELNIPARPFLIPGVKNAQPEITKLLKSATLNVIAQDTGAFKQRLNEAGIVAVSAVKAKIDSGPFEPLAESTLRARARKQAVSGGTQAERRAAKDALSSGDYSGINAQPLVDSGQLLNSISYILRKK